MPKYEYQWLESQRHQVSTSDLNREARAGWRVIFVSPDGTRILMERSAPVEPDKTPLPRGDTVRIP